MSASLDAAVDGFLQHGAVERGLSPRTLEAYGRDHLTQASSSGRLAFDSGVDGFRAQRRWVERALRTLAKEDS